MKTKRFLSTVLVRGAFVIAAIALLGACIMEPSDGSGGSGGTITINVPLSGSSVGGSSVSGSAITSDTMVRVWMYTPQGNEYRLAPTGTGLPTARNYVQARGGGSIVIDNIPAGDGYGLVVVVDNDITDNGGTFVPDRYALEPSFSVVGGRETQLSLAIDEPTQVEGLSGFTPGSVGENLNSVVVVDDGVYGATSRGVYKAGIGEINLQGSPTVNSLSAGEDTAEADALLINTSTGIQYYKSGSEASLLTGINNITGSGTFVNDGEVVVYYQRLGGLGGASDLTLDALKDRATSYWNDSGTDLSDVVAADESPIIASATSGNAAYISSVLGAFRATEEVFTGDDIDVDALLGGTSTTSGLTFFEVAYPGTSRSLRIHEIGLFKDPDDKLFVIVGAGRGAFYFPESAIDSANGGSVSNVQAVPQTDGQYIVDMAVNDGFVAILTPSRLIVARPGSGLTPRVVPLRAVTLGIPRDITLRANATTAEVYIAGSDGLSKITFTKQ